MYSPQLFLPAKDIHHSLETAVRRYVDNDEGVLGRNE